MQNAPFDYVAEANVTASNEFHGSKVPADYLKDILRDCINNIRLLDHIKKSIFYGRDLPNGFSGYSAFAGCELMPSHLSEDEATGELIFHSIVGLATEAGELLELLFASCFEGKKFDAVNFMEENGDCFWYQAIGAKAAGFSFDEAQRRNIAKLRHRFPNKFTEFDANNRDLLGERSILEGGGA